MSIQTQSNKGLIIWLSILAGLSAFASASILTDLWGEKVAGLFLAVVGSLNAGTAVYVAAFKPVESPTVTVTHTQLEE